MRLLKSLTISVLMMIGIITPLLAVTSTAQALDVLKPVCTNKDATGTPTVCTDNKGTSEDPLLGPNGVITKVVNILALVAGIISIFVMIIFGGIRFITAGGNPQTVNSARQTVIFSAIGLAIAAAAKLVVTFVISKAGQ